MKQYNVTVLGEHSSGKSFLVKALDGERLSKKSVVEREGGYWSRQFEGETALVKDGDSTFKFTEIMGSRGRRSNYGSLIASLKSAQIVLYCLPMNRPDSWIFESVNRVLNYFNSAKNAEAKLVLVGTMQDEADPKFTTNFDQVPVLRNFPFVPVSAIRANGVAPLLPAILSALESETPAIEFSRHYLDAKKKEQEEELEAKRKEEEEKKEAKKKEEEAKAKEQVMALWKVDDATVKKVAETEVQEIAPIA